MPKKKKTREQKMNADKRHKEYKVFPKPSDEVKTLQESIYIQTIKPVITTSHYSFLYTDLIKTIVLSFSIIIAELLLKMIFGAQ